MSGSENPKNSGIKGRRIRAYFIEAAKEIILREGVENVSVRKVADTAGYSYATIYNYFSDLNALLREVKLSMVQDMIAYMGGVHDGKVNGIDDIRKINRMYVGYYLQHPHIFRFFYSYRLTYEEKDAGQYFDYDMHWQDTYQCLVVDGTIRKEDIGVLAKTIIYAMHGLLALYFSDNGLTQEALLNDLDHLTEYLLKRRDLS